MSILLFLFSFCYSAASLLSHDIPLTMLTLSDNGDKLLLEIKIEAEDLATVLGQKNVALDDGIIKKYIIENTSLYFDGSKGTLEIFKLEENNKHLIIKARVKTGDFCQNIEISTSLLEEIPSHSNIFQLRIGSAQRDFRMHKARPSISIAL